MRLARPGSKLVFVFSPSRTAESDSESGPDLHISASVVTAIVVTAIVITAMVVVKPRDLDDSNLTEGLLRAPSYSDPSQLRSRVLTNKVPRHSNAREGSGQGAGIVPPTTL